MAETQPIAFRAEIRQLLDILVHSLYTEREIFLRELISNASDALNRLQFEMLTNREVLDPGAELGIWITGDPQARSLTIRDTGIGMTREELVENLGTIAHSGAKAFLEAAQAQEKSEADIIGQFGVGFYSVFMVAEEVRVTSRSYRPGAEAAVWAASGGDSYTVEAVEKGDRGTAIEIKLKEDAREFAEVHRLNQIVKRHSDFVAYPIYVSKAGEEAGDLKQANQQTALWRQSPREVEAEKYDEFYKQITLDFEKPLRHIHYVADAPVQIYSLLFIPAKVERGFLSLRREDGLKLYSHKILIQEYYKDLLPPHFRFVEGVVDSEDIPLNISRESVQASPVMARIKKALTKRLIDELESLAEEDAGVYAEFWREFGRYLKEGVASDMEGRADLYPLLRFHSTTHPDELVSLADYVSRMKDGQDRIYYIFGEDPRSAARSPHLDYFHRNGYEVLTLTDTIDSFMIIGLREFEGKKLQNVAAADLELPRTDDKAAEEESPEPIPGDRLGRLILKFKNQLGERVTDVRTTERLVDSPARLVDPQGAVNQEMQRVYKLLDREFEVPKKILELNPRHKLLKALAELPESDPLLETCVEQIYEDALLIEGIHPDPASMIPRLEQLMEAAAGSHKQI